MYTEFYGLKELPFNVTSDPDFLFMSRHHKEAFNHLIYGIQQRKGFLAITGEVGAGKTTLCLALLNKLKESVKTALILNPDLSPLQLLQAIVEDFGLPAAKTKIQLFQQLNLFLLQEASAGHNVVLIIDEAQNLKTHTLEQIRMLSNLETTKEKLFQIVLVGQPQLRDKLQDLELYQLRQRIAVRYHISPLDGFEVDKYIYHRLNVAGSSGKIHFSDEAIKLIFKYSNGIPRLINLVCDKALLLGFVRETYEIEGEVISRCIEELEGRFVYKQPQEISQ